METVNTGENPGHGRGHFAFNHLAPPTQFPGLDCDQVTNSDVSFVNDSFILNESL